MHNALLLWYKIVFTKEIKGDNFLVVYADDFIAGFQYKWEAEKYYDKLKERMGKFNLELEESKSRLLEFSKFAESNRKARGEGKPETFDFLGFTHYCSKSEKGSFRVKRKTSKKKYNASLKRCKQWLKDNLTTKAVEIMKKLTVKLNGYYRYYGVTDNTTMMSEYRDVVRKMLYKALNRRSQRKSFNWDKYSLFLIKHPLIRPKIYVNIYELRQELNYIL